MSVAKKKATIKKQDAVKDPPIEFYEKQIFDLKQLFEISKSLNSSLDYNTLIDSILYIIMGQMKVLKAALFAKKGLDSECFMLHRNYKGFEVDHSIEYSIPETHPVIEMFKSDFDEKRYRCYSLEEITYHLRSIEGLDALIKLEPSLVVPLIAKGRLNGIIILGEQIAEEAFTDYEKEYVLNIATLAAIAINNAFLFEMTTTDMMTKLKMKHYFYTILEEHFDAARRKRGKQPQLALLMADIDHFKNVNDTYGHLCGDAVLQEVARVLSTYVRQNDLAARYGGEEFCVLLPGTKMATAMEIAERIRKKIEADVVHCDGVDLKVTISIGVAMIDPVRDKTPKAFIDRADRALYRSKQEGRNRVSMAD
jgi:diguanylate cyclase (GGDEF)-like protein